MLEAMGAQLILGAQQILMVLGAQGAQGAQTMNCTKAPSLSKACGSKWVKVHYILESTI